METSKRRRRLIAPSLRVAFLSSPFYPSSSPSTTWVIAGEHGDTAQLEPAQTHNTTVDRDATPAPLTRLHGQVTNIAMDPTSHAGMSTCYCHCYCYCYCY